MAKFPFRTWTIVHGSQRIELAQGNNNCFFRYSLPIVTAYIKKEPKELENVLLKIKQLDKGEYSMINNLLNLLLLLPQILLLL